MVVRIQAGEKPLTNGKNEYNRYDMNWKFLQGVFAGASGATVFWLVFATAMKTIFGL